MFNTPILFIIFNKIEPTSTVFQKIREVKPKKLYISADGPRNEMESQKCNQVREIVDKVDWPCEVKKFYRKQNAGCKTNVSEAITWFFNNEERGIILEDDCLPTFSFFIFCEELLDKYKHDTRVFQIGGSNYGLKNIAVDFSYFFTKYVSIWGWATWKRAWDLYDLSMVHLDEIISEKQMLRPLFSSDAELDKRLNDFLKTKVNEIDTWDYIWFYTCLLHNGLTILPKLNQVSNIGFTEDATHTLNKDSHLNNIPTKELKFPIAHPPYIIRSQVYEESYYKPTTNNLFNKLKKISLNLLKSGK